MKSLVYLVSINGHKILGLVDWGGIMGLCRKGPVHLDLSLLRKRSI